ncbi:MAG: ABC transporter substrate-binding protein [Streptosporangiales bacterium]
MTGCTTGGSGGPGESGGGRTFDIGIGVDLDTVDPAQQTTTTVQNVIDYGIETLTRLDKNGKVQPGLAKSWETSKAGRVLTLHLRKGVTFHDGTDLTAKAVKFNLDRILDPDVKVPIRASFEVINKVEAVDNSTVRLHLKYPDPNLINNLGITIAGILSPKSVEKGDNTYKNVVKPVGTGPYEFVSFKKGDRVTYKKYDDYWGKKPYYDKVIFHIVPEGNSREAILRSGQADMVMNPPVSDLKSLQQSQDIDVLKAPSDRSIFIAFNNSKPPFDDPQVRRALNYAVNKKAIADKVLFGAVEVMDSPLASSVNGYCSAGTYEYNPKKAKSMLADAGKKKMSIVFGTPSGRYLQDKQAAQAIAADLSEVGVNAKVRTMDWPSYLAATSAPKDRQKFDMHLLGWAPGALDAPTQFQMFQRAEWPPHGLASAFYSNKKVESLIAKGNRELNEDKRNKLYCQAQKIIWHGAPWLFLWSQTLVLAYSSDVAGVSYIPNEKFNTIYAHPAK